MKELHINENDGGQRLDRFLSKLMPRMPKSMLYKGMRKNCVRLNGKHIKDGSVFISEGDVLTLYFKDEFFEKRDTGFKYVKPELDIAYEDENILVVNKAVGVLVHADDRGTAAATLIDMIKSYLAENGEYDPGDENSFTPALCNRLDRNTGGLLIAAKNAPALREMNEHIRSREVRKFYLAVVEGYPPEEGELRGYTERSGKVTTVSGKSSDKSREAWLKYWVKAKKNGYSLVEIELHTGRTHQIRAQFSAAGYPLAGDTKYGARGGGFRQALWSVRLVFDIGVDGRLGYLDGRSIEVKAPFEKDF